MHTRLGVVCRYALETCTHSACTATRSMLATRGKKDVLRESGLVTNSVYRVAVNRSRDLQGRRKPVAHHSKNAAVYHQTCPLALDTLTRLKLRPRLAGGRLPSVGTLLHAYYHC